MCIPIAARFSHRARMAEALTILRAPNRACFTYSLPCPNLYCWVTECFGAQADEPFSLHLRFCTN